MYLFPKPNLSLTFVFIIAVRMFFADARAQILLEESFNYSAGANLHGQNGVGLSNTRRRLQQLYGSQHEFHIRAAAGGGVSVTVVIPFRIYDGE